MKLTASKHATERDFALAGLDTLYKGARKGKRLIVPETVKEDRQRDEMRGSSNGNALYYEYQGQYRVNHEDQTFRNVIESDSNIIKNGVVGVAQKRKLSCQGQQRKNIKQFVLNKTNDAFN